MTLPRWIGLALIALAQPSSHETLARSGLPESSLAVRVDGEWRTWWRSAAPATSSSVLLQAIAWKSGASGVAWGETVLGGRGEAWRTRLVAVRLDPSRLSFRLDTAFSRGAAAWTIARAGSDVVFAINAGQFVESMPWGLVVLDGREYLSSGRGALASIVAFDSAGDVRFQHGGNIATRLRRVAWAFQSYPTLLRDGRVPDQLLGDVGAVDVGHRDARAAIGLTSDGRLVVAITRFDALGPALGFVPFGLTTPEMAGVMSALGARDAVMLDGGISAQLFLRDPARPGDEHRWNGARAVPVALVARTR